MNDKKYVLFLVSFFVLALWLPTATAKAAVPASSYIGASTIYEGQKGKVVKMNLYIHGNEKVAGGSLVLQYDKTALTVQKVEVGDQLANYLSSVNENQPGHVMLQWAKATGEVQDGTLLTITARLEKANQATTLTVQNAQLLREDYSAIPVKTLNGEVKPFKGKTQKHSSKVNANKAWTIRFNKAFNPATVNKYSVRVKDRQGNELDVDVKASAGNKEIVVTPNHNYAPGTYMLEITNQVQMSNGSQLKQPVQYEFVVQ